MANNNHDSPLADDDLLVNMLVLKPAHPEEEETIKSFRVPRRLLSSEESSTDVVPNLLSHTTLPQFFHRCPSFVKDVSEYVCSLASNAQQSVYFYHVVTDNAEACMCFWDYFFSTEKLSCREDIICMAYESEHWLAIPSGRISLQLDDGEQPQSERARPLESAAEALKELKLEARRTVCLHDQDDMDACESMDSHGLKESYSESRAVELS